MYYSIVFVAFLVGAFCNDSFCAFYDWYRGKKVLVTGGAGFIGSHLVEELGLLGAQVRILDDFSTGKYENIEDVKGIVEIFQGTIEDVSDCLLACQGQDIVFHLAAMVSVPLSYEYPERCFLQNVVGTHNILLACQKTGVQHVVFSSSAAVYGLTDVVCIETGLLAPESPYGYSKYLGEVLCEMFAKAGGLRSTILRYFNVFGERQDPSSPYSGVISKFKDCLEKNMPMMIFGDGLQTRDFVNVKRVVAANLAVAFLGDRAAGQIFNVATGKSITLLDLIHSLRIDFPAYDQKIVFKEARVGDLVHSKANVDKLNAVFSELGLL